MDSTKTPGRHTECLAFQSSAVRPLRSSRCSVKLRWVASISTGEERLAYPYEHYSPASDTGTGDYFCGRGQRLPIFTATGGLTHTARCRGHWIATCAVHPWAVDGKHLLLTCTDYYRSVREVCQQWPRLSALRRRILKHRHGNDVIH